MEKVLDAPLATDEDVERLRRFDTPTICNALERVVPERRPYGYTSESFVCARPELPPAIGYARTATIRSRQPGSRSASDARAHRLRYLKYLADGPKPFVVVIQDLDGYLAGYGSFWGEVHSTIHQALGAVAAVTDGAIRDVDQLAPGFQLLARKIVPSHAYDHLVDFGGEVSVCGMVVRSGELVHLDRHGAVVVPVEAVTMVPAAADLIARREAVILEACRRPDFNYDRLVEALGESDQID
jgi:regulator of RNase E activity RraA